MTLKLKPYSNPPSPFSWRALSPNSVSSSDNGSLPSPPTAWLPAQDMKLYGPQSLPSGSGIGLVSCRDCGKTVLRTYMIEHTEKCAAIRAGSKKGNKGRTEAEDAKKLSKKRKASPSPDEGPKKKAKPATKVTKGRMRGPVDYDKQCGVINDKNLPCSRSLTCKSHSMGAKRAVQGRSKPYDELLLEWQRANNPNFVEPVKRETKAEKKEKREREKLEKKRLADEAAPANDPNAPIKKGFVSGSLKKVGKKAAGAAAVRQEDFGEDTPENMEELDTEAEMDELVHAIRIGRDKGIIGVPLAQPCDAGTWFVQRRERARCCRDLLVNALGGGGMAAGISSMGIISRSGSIGRNG
ncbi:hypothetical protein M378DRAFT_789303 [Amanita muscaria Koide BX008]|uniref:SCA7 domain-containing protein n=1 Tax=Amanita muscaria (strain Koide BX008) TaxID=946122 RepID=A0A0C2X5G2_AMAMK|nr:hypothetical protein M378DRAFT_789303 [Amanita muscaria Koide BX008]